VPQKVPVMTETNQDSEMEAMRPRRRIRWAAVLFWAFSGGVGLWLILSITVHLFGGRDLFRTTSAMSARADNPVELQQCWQRLFRLYDNLVFDFGRQVQLLRRYHRDLKASWGGRYGWDLLPLDQLSPEQKDREHMGPWRWRLTRVRGWCRLDERDVLYRSEIVALLSQVANDLDQLRVALTGRIKSIAEPQEVSLRGGEQTVIERIRKHLAKARRLINALAKKKGRGPVLLRGQPWKARRCL